jgi:hypothetical protein
MAQRIAQKKNDVNNFLAQLLKNLSSDAGSSEAGKTRKGPQAAPSAEKKRTTQKMYFSANWTRRGFTDVLVICPATGMDISVTLGLLNCA